MTYVFNNLAWPYQCFIKIGKALVPSIILFYVFRR